jgi:hypothetical protein
MATAGQKRARILWFFVRLNHGPAMSREVNAMSCPPEIADVILDILQKGLLRIRALGWSGNSAACASEADHLHNLPSLLSNYSPELLRYYWEAEKPGYCSRGDGDPKAFAPAWERLHSLLKRRGMA